MSESSVGTWAKVTLEAGYQGFIGGHVAGDAETRGLKMTRVSIRMNDIMDVSAHTENGGRTARWRPAGQTVVLLLARRVGAPTSCRDRLFRMSRQEMSHPPRTGIGDERT